MFGNSEGIVSELKEDQGALPLSEDLISSSGMP